MSMHTEDGKEIVVVDHIYERGGISVRPVTEAQLVAALIAEGGEIMPSSHGFQWQIKPGDVRDFEPGRYLVYGPLPVESAEATPKTKETRDDVPLYPM